MIKSVVMQFIQLKLHNPDVSARPLHLGRVGTPVPELCATYI